MSSIFARCATLWILECCISADGAMGHADSSAHYSIDNGFSPVIEASTALNEFQHSNSREKGYAHRLSEMACTTMTKVDLRKYGGDIVGDSASAGRLLSPLAELLLCGATVPQHLAGRRFVSPIARRGAKRTAAVRMMDFTDYLEEEAEEGPPKREGPPMNEEIQDDPLRVTFEDDEGNTEMLGIISLDEALDRADEEGVDLVLITPDADPPVAKIVDYSKVEFRKRKKKQEQKKSNKQQGQKELKMSYKIGPGDYKTRIKSASKFLSDNNRVKLTIIFKGREQQFLETMGKELVERITEDVQQWLIDAESGVSVTCSAGTREANRFVAVLSPK